MSKFDKLFERRNHERSKEKTIEELYHKILVLNELKKSCTNTEMEQYYRGYIQAYNDCIDIIQKDQYY